MQDDRQRYINPYRFFQGAMVPNCIMRLRDLSQTAKLVYGRLCQYAGRNGEAWPSLDKLAEEVGLTNWRQAHRSVRELEQYGLLEIVKRVEGENLGDGRKNAYRFPEHPLFFENNDSSGGGTDSSPQRKSPPRQDHKKPVRNDRYPDGQKISGGKIPVISDRKYLSDLSKIPVISDKKYLSDLSLEENHIRESVEENQKKTRGRSASAAKPSDPDRRDAPVDQTTGEKKQPERYSEQDLALARHMVTVLTANNPGFRPPSRVERWAHEIRLMRERDQRPETEIGHVFDFAAADAFWRQNILSPGALRRNYAKLTARMIAQGSRHAPSIEREKPVRFCRDCRDFGRFDCTDNSPTQMACCMFSPAKRPGQHGFSPLPLTQQIGGGVQA